MKRIDSLDLLPQLQGSVVTDGMFDGVHVGHQRILSQVVEEAKERNLPSVLLTYWPHPRHVLSPESEKLKLLTTLKEKTELVEQQGIDFMLVLEFNREFSEMSHIRFTEEVLVNRLHTKTLIVGYDHRFGKDRLGNFEYLEDAGRKHGFDLKEISRQEVEEIGISSTKIRYALQHRLIETANQFLGRLYSISGTVEKGDQRGRTIGYPTANLVMGDNVKLIPADGVYATYATVNGHRHKAMTNLGFRPTVGGRFHRIETHLLDFEGDLYGKNLLLEFVAPIREEQKFASFELLKNQLELDKQKTKELLAD